MSDPGLVIRLVNWAGIRTDDRFRLSYPLRPELFQEFRQQFFHLPALLIDAGQSIVSGWDFVDVIKAGCPPGEQEVTVLQGDFTGSQALILAFNLRQKLWGFNLYEKLVFIHKALSLMDREEIYRRTALDLPITPELIDKLPLLLGKEFQAALMAGRLTLKTALRLADFSPADRPCIIDLFYRLPFTASQQLKIVDMVEEIVFRDQLPLADIVKELNIGADDGPPATPDKIMETVFRRRFPIFQEKEREWQAGIKALKLPPHYKVSHYPFFEREEILFQAQLPDIRALKALTDKMKPSL